MKLNCRINKLTVLIIFASFFFALVFIDCETDAAEVDNASDALDIKQQDGKLTETREPAYPVVAQVAGGYDDVFFIMQEELISIASKTEERAANAPSIITVITSEEIENMGAKILPDIIRTIPGFDIIKDAAFGRIEIGSRGVRKADRRIKLLVNGHTLNNHWNGGFSYWFDSLPLKNVKRIEIIRGPGSALYGNSAFLAVINVITKGVSDINGIEVSAGFGTYDTQKYSILAGKTLHGVDVAGYIDFYNTNGFNGSIGEEALLSQPLSQAPGQVDDSRNKFDVSFNVSHKDIKLYAKYMNKDAEPFAGTRYLLTDDGERMNNYATADLSYKLDLGDKITVKPRAYFDQYDIDYRVNPFPDGFTVNEDLDNDGDIEAFPEGKNLRALGSFQRLGSEIQTDYKLSNSNIVTFGFSYIWERNDNIQHYSNFDPLTGASLGSMQNVSDNANYMAEVTRQIWAVYFQDKWDITNKLGLTLGVRHDHYSDFEGTTNPRLGLVWDFMDNAALKVLYGQAFRAPGFVELYQINAPVRLGNPSLKPETIRTYEVGIDYKFSKKLTAGVNYFFNVIRDEIAFAPVALSDTDTRLIHQNVNSSNIQGIEFETNALLSDFWPGAYAFANYTYLDAESKGGPLPDVPKHKGNLGVNFGITKYLNANLHTFISGPRVRAESDTRDDSPGYAIANLTLIAKDFFKDMKITASLFNIFDKQYDDPTPMGTLPSDIPRPGRTFYVELGYEF